MSIRRIESPRSCTRTLAERPDYYAILGLKQDASSADIRTAYRRLVLSHHPDRHPDDPVATTRLKHLVEAYEVLGDPPARRIYDEGGVIPMPAAEGVSWDELLGRVVDSVVGAKDLRSVAGRDHQYRLSLTLREAARGCTKVLELPIHVLCESCEGRGFPLEAFPTICPQCQGTGASEARHVLRKVVDHCAACTGKGYQVAELCALCEGCGTQEVRKPVSIDVPAGVLDGARLVVRGAGQPGVQGGADGDCFVVVRVEPDPVLRVIERDVVMTRPVTALQALTGGWVRVPTLDGTRKLRLPANVRTDTVLRMTGLGVGADDEPRGDQLVTLTVEFPVMLDDEARDAFTAIAARLGAEAFPQTACFDREHGGRDDVVPSDEGE